MSTTRGTRTQGTQTTSSFICITKYNPPDLDDENKKINGFLQIAGEAIDNANQCAENLQPSSNGFKKRIVVCVEDDIEEHCKRIRREKFQKHVKEHGGHTYAAKLIYHKSDASDDELEEGEVKSDEDYCRAFSPFQCVEGRSYTPDFTPPISPNEGPYRHSGYKTPDYTPAASPTGLQSGRCYSPYDSDA
jgi:hypothetical protein